MSLSDQLEALAEAVGSDLGSLWAQLNQFALRTGTAKDIRLYGAELDDPSAAQTNSQALRAMLAGGGRCYVPAGKLWLEPVSDATEARAPGSTKLFGDGPGLSVLALTAATSKHWNVLTNAGNTRTAHTAVDRFITISDLTIDANGFNRPTTGTPAIDEDNSSGCGIALASVEHALITDVEVINGYLHNISIDASMYCDSTLGAAGRTLYPAGPSRNVVVRNFFLNRPKVDDAATCHASIDVTFQDGLIDFGTDPSVVGETQNGVEIDEGMVRGRASRVTVRGAVKGFQVKGHPDTPPARDTLLDSITAIGCNVGLAVEWASSAASPNLAKGVEVRDLVVRNPVEIPAYGKPELLAMTVSGYRGVDAKVLADGGPGNGILIYSDAQDVEIDGELDNGAWTVPTTAAKGWIQTDATCKDIRVPRVKAHTPVGGTLVSSFHSGRMEVSDVSGDALPIAATLPMVRLQASVNASQTAVDLDGTGWYGLSRVATGIDAGYYQGDYEGNVSFRTADWTTVPIIAPNTTGSIRFAREGKFGIIEVRGLTSTAASGWVDICALPAAPGVAIPSTSSFLRNDAGTAAKATISAAGVVNTYLTQSGIYNGDLIFPISLVG